MGGQRERQHLPLDREVVLLLMLLLRLQGAPKSPQRQASPWPLCFPSYPTWSLPFSSHLPSQSGSQTRASPPPSLPSLAPAAAPPPSPLPTLCRQPPTMISDRDNQPTCGNPTRQNKPTPKAK